MDILKYVLNLIKDYWFFGGLPSSAELYLRVLVAFNVVFGLLILVMYFHQGFYTFFALFTRAKKWREAKVRHKYAYMICAHDEEKVIGNLIAEAMEKVGKDGVTTMTLGAAAADDDEDDEM